MFKRLREFLFGKESPKKEVASGGTKPVKPIQIQGKNKDDLESKDKKELLSMAKEKGLKANANMKKDTLIEKLRDS